MYTCMYIYIYIYISAFMCVYMDIYIYILSVSSCRLCLRCVPSAEMLASQVRLSFLMLKLGSTVEACPGPVK